MSNREMDRQFSLDDVGNLDALFARRSAAAEAALSAFDAEKGIPYEDAPGRKLNIFPHAGKGHPAPVQIFIHGGFWRSLDADLFSFLVPGFVPFGAMLVVVDYPLMPACRMADVVDACRMAVGWTYRNCAQFGGDPDRIFISGNSAGGHLVAELADRTWLDGYGLPRNVIKGTTAISGIFDLDPVRRSFQNDALLLTDEEIRAFSPLYRKLDIAGPLIVTVGGEETAEFLRQSAAFAQHATSCGATVSHMPVPQTNHITIVLDALAEPGHQLNRAVRTQMGL
ncbi:alpha/beta hydrolase (plasmid) [Aquamicrobium terrae]